MKIIDLKKSDIAELEAARKTVADQLGAITGANKTLEKLLARRGKLTNEIAELESATPDDSAAIKKLAEKRTELDLCERRISEIPPLDPETEVAMQGLLREGDHLLLRLLAPTYQAFLSEISKALRPYCISDDWANKIASETQAAQSLSRRLWVTYGSWNVVAGATQLVRQLDEILSGEIAWTFDSKSS